VWFFVWGLSPAFWGKVGVVWQAPCFQRPECARSSRITSFCLNACVLVRRVVVAEQVFLDGVADVEGVVCGSVSTFPDCPSALYLAAVAGDLDRPVQPGDAPAQPPFGGACLACGQAGAAFIPTAALTGYVPAPLRPRWYLVPHTLPDV
jgi:hypothetical protein